jgi:O-antigen ligase
LIIWSGSDAGLITFVVTIIICLAWITGRLLYLITFGAACTLIAFIALNNFGWLTQVVTFLIPPRLLTLLNSALESWNIRTPFYKCAAQLIQEKPLFGWGIGKFFPECSSRIGMEMPHAHNIVLQLGADIGLPLTILIGSLVGYIIFLCFCFFRASKSKDTKIYRLAFGCLLAVLSLILMQLFDLGLLMSYRLNFLFWICLAIPYSLASQPKFSEAL